MLDIIVILTADFLEWPRKSAAQWGRIAIAYDEAEKICRVAQISTADGKLVTSPAFTYAKPSAYGLWCYAQKALHDQHENYTRTGLGLSAADFRASLDAEPEMLAIAPNTIVLTYCLQASPELAAWWVSAEQVFPLDMDVLRAATDDPLQVLKPNWPLRDLGGEIAIIGVGSIGSATAHALAMYGARKITLVDDDRLRWHNLVRHQSTRHSIGRFKVDAVSEAITTRWPATQAQPLRLNVISDADRMRPLFSRCSLVVCAADGVAPRRVVSHLARRAEKTAVLACVLLDGAFGEVIRLRPWPGSGCLLCLRAQLESKGIMSPEPALDSDYGTGTTHRPMTAVGTDLAMIGQLAAKVAVGTLLEDAGHYDQRIARDWAVMGLRRDITAPDPFDLHPGEIRWLPSVGSLASCPTCGTS